MLRSLFINELPVVAVMVPDPAFNLQTLLDRCTWPKSDQCLLSRRTWGFFFGHKSQYAMYLGPFRHSVVSLRSGLSCVWIYPEGNADLIPLQKAG